MFDLSGANACEALWVRSGIGVQRDGLKTAQGLSAERAVDGALQRVPWELIGHSHILIIDKDAPAPVVHPNEVNLRHLCGFFAHSKR